MRQIFASFSAAVLFATAAPALAATQLTGAGSTFDYPFFSKAFYEYNKLHRDVEVNYQSIGSGGGIQQFTQRTVDFGATDVPMNVGEIQAAKSGGGPVLQIPVALAGESVVYNVPGVGSGLHLPARVLADLFLGKISSWSDARIAKANPHVKLPNLPVIVVHRSDGSGTTYIFTDYLSRVSSEWKAKIGTGKSVAWPASSAIGGKGNEGVAGQVGNNPGSIGYVELAYVSQNKMPQAVIQNAAGKWIGDTPRSVRAAAAAKPDVTPGNFSIVNMKCASCYPIAGYSWIVVYQNPQDKVRGKLLHEVLKWLTGSQAQKIAGTLDYVPLPNNIQTKAAKTLEQMHV
jgi:phosphate transport system substrate-binding protein